MQRDGIAGRVSGTTARPVRGDGCSYESRPLRWRWPSPRSALSSSRPHQRGPASARGTSRARAPGPTILKADGYLAASGVDCRFGPVTTAATKRWQRDRGLVSDGVVGPKTFAKAATRLRLYEGESWFYYDGLGTNFAYFGRRADGR
ncbi:peptidoglycan-binding domain-containing protein [Micromonospora coriariae]|uniref:peptidoglycan-binding domain-containing protein n=1 Tax=Micromonospora coriariae TaxID=285665 RepID=UPI0022B264D3|nr:peptidoglycan-binding domain-containing protein [Micromonospora coriariae]